MTKRETRRMVKAAAKKRMERAPAVRKATGWLSKLATRVKTLLGWKPKQTVVVPDTQNYTLHNLGYVKRLHAKARASKKARRYIRYLEKLVDNLRITVERAKHDLQVLYPRCRILEDHIEAERKALEAGGWSFEGAKRALDKLPPRITKPKVEPREEKTA